MLGENDQKFLENDKKLRERLVRSRSLFLSAVRNDYKPMPSLCQN